MSDLYGSIAGATLAGLNVVFSVKMLDLTAQALSSQQRMIARTMKPQARKTVLTYPKSQGFTKPEVLKARGGFQFPRAWDFSHTERSLMLTFDPSKAAKVYLKKKRR